MNINPNDWSCIPTSFANVIGKPVGLLIGSIGHDGSAQYASGLRRGFHSQECIEVLDHWGYSVVCIDLYPELAPDGVGEEGECLGCYIGNPKDRLKYHMELDNGVLCGILNKEGRKVGHAVSWNVKVGRLHDPRGCGLPWAPEDFLYKCFEPKLFFKVRA